MTDATADMDDTPEGEGAAKKKGGLVGILLIAVLALAAAGGTFYAVSSGLLDGLLGREPAEAPTDAEDASPAADGSEAAVDHSPLDLPREPSTGSFHALPPISVSLGTGGAGRQLRMQAVLEIDPDLAERVGEAEPRIQDTLLSYLRAVEPSVLEDPLALLRVRAHMLRRARMAATDAGLADGTVVNLLVTDFVLN